MFVFRHKGNNMSGPCMPQHIIYIKDCTLPLEFLPKRSQTFAILANFIRRCWFHSGTTTRLDLSSIRNYTSLYTYTAFFVRPVSSECYGVVNQGVINQVINGCTSNSSINKKTMRNRTLTPYFGRNQLACTHYLLDTSPRTRLCCCGNIGCCMPMFTVTNFKSL